MENIKKRSRLFHDRPMSPMDTAIYWIEYIIRHNGASHLRVVGKDLPWYQYLMLDVIGFLLIVLWLIVQLIYSIARFIALKRKKMVNLRNKNKFV